MAEYDQRTEQATPRRRQKAREEGQVARSRELSSIAALGGIILVLYFGGRYAVSNITVLFGKLLSLQYGKDPFTVLRAVSFDTILILLPFFSAALVFGVGTSVLQGGFVLKPLGLQIGRINPLEGLKRIFSMNGVMDFLKSLIKFAAGGLLIYLLIKKNLPLLPPLMEMETYGLIKRTAGLVMNAVLYGFVFFFILSIGDFLIEKWRYERSLRMSKEEIKEEARESEGDPLLKSRIRSLQREMARRRMIQQVPKATVVITNPTHLAVALQYEDGKTSAPLILAKGAGYIAQKIKEVAKKHNVPVVEDKPLARALFKLEIDSFIPAELYRAVAKILAYIYKLKGAA
ncbi:MAG: flagellar biosynthesis protein FlhB [Nitrospirae bacterium]|nr:flagellar biosynthesis protein FlhB [Nitrospirota bacterium]